MKTGFQNLKVEYLNHRQILNMGGPWVGDLLINNSYISDNVIIDNLLYDQISQDVFFVKFNDNKAYWLKDVYFTICKIDLQTNTFVEYAEKFSKVYLHRKISDCELEIYKAFHNKNNNVETFNFCSNR